MKNPKVKKRKNYWLVYTNKKQVFKCYSEFMLNLCYNTLKAEQLKNKI